MTNDNLYPSKSQESFFKSLIMSPEEVDDLFAGAVPVIEEPLPVGPYVCKYRSAKQDTNSKGTPYIQITFEVIFGEHTGRFIWHKLWTSEKARSRTLADLARLLDIRDRAGLESALAGDPPVSSDTVYKVMIQHEPVDDRVFVKAGKITRHKVDAAPAGGPAGEGAQVSKAAYPDLE